MTKHMILSDGVAYVEVPVIQRPKKPKKDWECTGCSFESMDEQFCKYIAPNADAAFGRTCGGHPVIYIKADPQPKKCLTK